jgi:hypothetical protein
MSESENIIQLIESLARELQEFREEVRTGLRTSVERIEQAVRRHSTAITAGTLSIGGLTKAIERIEAMIEDRDKQIADLRQRVRLLEGHRQ